MSTKSRTNNSRPKRVRPSQQLLDTLSKHDLWTAHDDRLRYTGALYENLDLRPSLSDYGFADASINGALFENCDLRDGTFTRTSLRDARFIGCDLRNCYFKDAILVDAQFEDCDLRGAYLGGARLVGTDFIESKLSTATSFSGSMMSPFRIVFADTERGYVMYEIPDTYRGPHVTMGCRTFTLNEAWTHWQKYKGGVYGYYLDHIQALAKKYQHKLRIIETPKTEGSA